MSATVPTAMSEFVTVPVGSGGYERLLIALACSIALHVILLTQFNPLQFKPAPATSARIASILELTLNEQIPESEAIVENPRVVQEIPAAASTPAASASTDESTDDLSDLIEISPANESVGIPAKRGTNTFTPPKLITTLPADSYSPPGLRYDCNAQDAKTEIRRCASEERELDRALSTGRFYGSFKRALARLTPKTTLHKDLLRIDALLDEHRTLEAMAESGDIDPEVVRESQKRLTEEIDRIDNKYATFDLFETIAAGGLVAKEVVRIIAEKTE
ncbi:MAG: hypothetical protein AAGI24_00665 [Pseudomonadota bacterium]